MFKEFFLKELGFAFKRPMIYIFFLIIALFVFGAVVSDNIVIGGSVGNVYKNAPQIVTTYTILLTVIGLMFATTYFNNAALRDHSYNFQEIMFSSPIDKGGYFFGKFAGALVASSFVFSGIFFAFILGGFIGPAMNWIGAERIGPIPWKAFLNNYLIFIVPNMFLAGAIIYGLATKFKNTIISFVGTLIIIVAYIVSLNLMSDLDNENIGAMADMFGVAAQGLDSKYYTPHENNTIAPSLTGHTLKNRLIWSSIGIIILLLSYYFFSFKSKKTKVKKQKKSKALSVGQIAKPITSNITSPSVWNQFTSFFKINFISIFKSTLFKILLLFGIIMVFANNANSFDYFGLKSYPVTYKLLDEIHGLAGFFIYIIIIFFSGELVWRDRDSHVNEVVDGTPHSSAISLFAKTASLIAIASILHFIFILASMVYQTFLGYTNYEMGIYLTDFFYQGLIPYTIIGLVMIFIQVVVNHKYLGYFISVLLLFLLDLVLLVLKIESGMVQLAHMPSMRYSDMNKFGPGLTGAKWFSLYWVLFALLLLLVAGLLWPRGKNSRIRDRYRQGMKSLSKSYTGVLGLAAVAWIACAGFVYYNTQILNPYKTNNEMEKIAVDYEKTYSKYKDLVLPKITDIVYDLDIYPEKRNVDVKADMIMVNKSNEAISEIHFNTASEIKTNIRIPNSTLALNDTLLGYQIYKLDQTMNVGDSLSVQVVSEYRTKGFSNNVRTTSVVKNGTFFNNLEFLPSLGYSSNAELSDKNKRRKYELPKKERMPELQDNCSQLCMKNYLSDGSSDWVNVETYISTSDDQVAVAPGSLISMDEENGRRQYHYKVDHPSLNFYSFISADFEIAKRKWNGIDLEVYYHESHGVNVERMLDAIQKSLEYYTTHFGPYFHKQARIIEFPRYSNFAQAFPGTMPYSESFGFIINLEGEDKNNVIDAVIAHEMAHQYWAHQVIGATMQGATMLSESFAEYSSLMVMKQTTPELKMKDFLKYDMNRYLRGRSSETDKELPLHKVENQMHIHYGKGSIVMYALQEYIGEDQVNAALREFLEAYRYQEPPYPTSNDFLRFLEPKVPDSLSYLVSDWIKDITLYDLRMKEANYAKLDNGQYEVVVNLTAIKNKADTLGNQIKMEINDWVDIGFYKDSDEEELLLKNRILISEEENELTFLLDTIPAKVAVDPLRLLVERVYKDNVKTVVEME